MAGVMKQCIFSGCYYPESGPCIGMCKQPGPGNIPTDHRKQEEDLICEALVDEIANAPRWIAAVGAWQALLNVRRMARAMREEHDYLNTATAGAQGPQRG